ncbi:Uncharacterized conserved protein YcbK, DUF882 family [Monaibacterium marinum]|uniref:Murein endopeptidase K n=1 Tax=Pontivivens marinum TaxID=1690039 RepID=A0A2C9CW81_9RHOB|nr:DUF882 domain-containing protein [Monaibacterium marinum]SOH95554.1 Uncharacterized conserved protein YcbK, DUF882 family [Monaibacterium marinum]
MTDVSVVSRRSLLGGLVGLSAIAAAPSFADTPAVLTGAGDIRSLKLYNPRTGERLDSVYWVEGEYIPQVLDEVNFIFRDWRRNELRAVDVRTIDIMAAASRMMETTEPYQLMSGYRSPETNNALRASNRGVARNSYHMRAMAADLRLSTRSVQNMYDAGVSCNAGGVGRYPRSNFVHFDCGPVRTWRG